MMLRMVTCTCRHKSCNFLILLWRSGLASPVDHLHITFSVHQLPFVRLCTIEICIDVSQVYCNGLQAGLIRQVGAHDPHYNFNSSGLRVVKSLPAACLYACNSNLFLYVLAIYVTHGMSALASAYQLVARSLSSTTACTELHMCW